MKKIILKTLYVSTLFFTLNLQGQETITIDIESTTTPISPYIYGKNGGASGDPQSPLTTSEWKRLNESGIKMIRENGGNNCTKYNWNKKLTSHPDWYNNIYNQDWDFSISSITKNAPQITALYGFQLTGKVANSKSYNFNDWSYNKSAYWEGVAQNLAGNGTPNTTGGTKATTEGDITLYTKDWPADSTVAILNKWRNSEMAIPDKNIMFWNMDNEPDIWNSTHDDVIKTTIEAEVFIEKYVAVAKAARLQFPNIKLVGPVAANEWQWYNWQKPIAVSGKNYCWMEYFIKRIAEEEKKSGVKLLDVLDVHFYPGTKVTENALQLHRVFFDSTYIYNDANGVKTVNGGWDESIKTEMFFNRCKGWMNKYMGNNYNVSFGISESDIQLSEPTIVSIWYASNIGEWMRHPEMTLFTPWSWKVGMWETVHLMARYNHANYIKSTSTNENLISAYPSINDTKDSVTIVLINRNPTSSTSTTVNINNANAQDNTLSVLQLNNLTTTETFVSHSNNALKSSTVTLNGNSFTVELPPLSITSVQIPRKASPSAINDSKFNSSQLTIHPNPTSGEFVINGCAENENIEIYNTHGELLKRIKPSKPNPIINIEELDNGMYIVKIINGQNNRITKIIKQ